MRREVTGTGGQNPKNWWGTASCYQQRPSVPAICHQAANGGVQLVQVDGFGQVHREAGVGEEMREVEQELEEKEHDLARRDRKLSNPHSLESGRLGSRSPSPSKSGSHGAGSGGLTNLFSLLLSPAWVQTFIMTFLGEWGDRSQIATIAMAAGQDYWWVTLGAVSGHAICTGLAVLGGRALAGRVSMRVGKFRSSFQLSVEQHANNSLFSHDRRRRCILGFRRAVPLGGVLRKIDLVRSGPVGSAYVSPGQVRSVGKA